MNIEERKIQLFFAFLLLDLLKVIKSAVDGRQNVANSRGWQEGKGGGKD